jgi:hypothetical protein
LGRSKEELKKEQVSMYAWPISPNSPIHVVPWRWTWHSTLS